jgi:hypothetical protein
MFYIYTVYQYLNQTVAALGDYMGRFWNSSGKSNGPRYFLECCCEYFGQSLKVVHKLEIPEVSKFLNSIKTFPNHVAAFHSSTSKLKLPPKPKWRVVDHFSAWSLDLFCRMLKEEI